MWRRPLNSTFNYYHPQKIRKAARYDRYLNTRLDDKQVDDGNGSEGTIEWGKTSTRGGIGKILEKRYRARSTVALGRTNYLK